MPPGLEKEAEAKLRWPETRFDQLRQVPCSQPVPKPDESAIEAAHDEIARRRDFAEEAGDHMFGGHVNPLNISSV
jgi:hypothetical protein